ncbi:MAG: 16S rRNA (adenine(1518)-N(6)/adenine(1519)-N(6))-dimethyltransferase RsmA [Candidatus Nomurabacteria bacterium]|nr:16S rRNA (adenine(1518)-N(6)/adenine(1519)-N(6))-dimethyltransferase RsmA [Candidatus Nomurabacteria bacterium]
MKTIQHKAKKSLGQNFLKSVPALHAIVNAGEIKDTDTILEIGPGKGALTEKLLEVAGTVIAIEKDRDLLEFLQTKFSKKITEGKFILINGDVLEVEDSIVKNLGRSDGDGQRKSLAKDFRVFENAILHGGYKIIANIPYNITGAILKKFLTAENQPERMVLMVQNEVAKRIVARDGSESILSISVKAYGNPKIIMKVPARYFSPAPKVDSAIIAITEINRNNFKNKNLEEKFWELVKTGFAHKRKILLSNLKELARQDLASIFVNLKIPEKARAENLKPVDWLEIAKKL